MRHGSVSTLGLSSKTEQTPIRVCSLQREGPATPASRFRFLPQTPGGCEGDVEYEMFALALFLIGKLLLDPLPCSRPEMPAKIIPAPMDFLCPFQ